MLHVGIKKKPKQKNERQHATSVT